MESIKRFANVLSGIIGLVAPSLFAVMVYLDRIPQNIATWGMICINNVIGIYLVTKEGNATPYMQWGWLISSTGVFVAIVCGANPVHWGAIETYSLAACVLAIGFRVALGATAALLAYVSAVLISSLPLIIDYWYLPQVNTWWLWASTVVSCSLAIFGAKERTVSYVLVPGFIGVLNAFILYLTIR